MTRGGHSVRGHAAKQAAALTALATILTLVTAQGAGAHVPQPRAQSSMPSGPGLRAEASSAVPSNVRLVRQRTSLLGTHRWYRQVAHGHFVVGGWYARHIATSGKVTVWNGLKRVSNVRPTHPVISAAQARGAATKVATAKSLHVTTEPLMVLPTKAGRARLVWPVSTATGQGAGTKYVDAGTGRILKTVSAPQLVSRTAARPSTVRGRGRVFDPNPVVALQNEQLRDHNDSASAVPRTAYRSVPLPRLAKSGKLIGKWVRMVNARIATSKSHRYFYNRSDNRFEQVSAYHAVDAEQNYLQTLGFRDVNARPQKVRVDAFPDDNSYYNPATKKISLGSGGVDDAEDPEVVWHEYGHAIQSDQVLDFGWTREAKAIGEGFGDYMAVTMSQSTARNTKLTPLACVMDWDATAYTARSPHCLRRTDRNFHYPGDLTGEPHADGQIWSRALWDMNGALGRDKATRIIIEAQFWMNPKVTMPEAAHITVSTARNLYGDHVAAITHHAFGRRGIL